MKATQSELLLAHMRMGGAVTQAQALREWGIGRLAARIHDMRSRGIKILVESVNVVNRSGETCRVAQYRMLDDGSRP